MASPPPLSGTSFFLPDVPFSSHPLLPSSSPSSSSHGSASASRSIDPGVNDLHAKPGSNRDPSPRHLDANRESKHTSEPKPARHSKPRPDCERKSKLLSSMLNLRSKPKTERKKKDTELVKSIRACGEARDLRKAREIHDDLIHNGGTIASDVYAATALITTYAKCGALDAARDVLEHMPNPDVVAWTALISGYVQNGEGCEALRCFARMKSSGRCPNSLTYVFVLKALGIARSPSGGEAIEAEMRRQGLLSSKKKGVVLGNALVGMYAKCGAMKRARAAFEEMPGRDVVTWNTLLTGYARNGLGEELLKCFAMMREDPNVSPDAVTYVCVLKGCGLVGCLEMGEAIGAEIRKQKLSEKDTVLGTALLDMYCKCGAMEKAREVFDQQLSQRNVVTWSALISGYAHNGLGDEALKCFEQMKSMGIDPNPVTYISVLKACGIVGSSELGKDIDAKLRKQGLLQIEDDVVLGTALVDMYAKCGEMERAREVFGEMSERNVVTWNALIAGLAQHGLGNEALSCFAEMKDAGICADERTYVSVLQACGIVGCLEIGEDVDAELRRRPWLWQRNLVLGTALVDMYARCGALEKAQEVLEELPEKNPAAWSALIAGYVEHGFDDNALQCFAQMKDAGIRRSTATYISVLKACGSVGSLAIGESVAEEIPKGLLEKDGVLGTALLDMYSKCGAPRKAREAFDQLLLRDDVSWNALIAGYGQLGQADAALRAYQLMRAEGVLPNRISFVLLLSACSHSGLLEEGQALLDEMSVCCSLAPTLEHFACLVDLFGRAGHFDKMKALLDEAPSSCHAPLLQSILAACRKWKNVELGRWAFDQLVKSDSECAYAYVCMGDIYAVSGTRREAYGIESFSR